MDQKVGALYGSLSALLDLEDSVKGDQIDDSGILLDKINKFSDSLRVVAESGRVMDEGVRVPADMMDFLEGEVSNPELYKFKAYEETAAKATAIGERKIYLEEIRANCEEGEAAIRNGSSGSNNSTNNTSTSHGGAPVLSSHSMIVS